MFLFKNGDSQASPRSTEAQSQETELWNLNFLIEFLGPFLDSLKPENPAADDCKCIIVHYQVAPFIWVTGEGICQTEQKKLSLKIFGGNKVTI